MEKDIIRYYINLVEFLGESLGPDYEIVLYDMRDGDGRIVAISNGRISGRSIGDPLSTLSEKRIANKDYEKVEHRTNYNGVTGGNKFIRCSTQYIKDGSGNLVGLLCLNFDDIRYKRLAETVLGLCHPDEMVTNNFFQKVDDSQIIRETEDIQETVQMVSDRMIEGVFERFDNGNQKLGKDGKMRIVEELERRGVFQLKTSVESVAKRLNISEATLYRYISEIKSN